MKKAILAVSFGTTFPSEEQACILPVENALRETFPDCDVFRAYSSDMILKKLQGSVESVPEALLRLSKENYEIRIVPTTIIPGNEYERIRAAADGLPVAEPLLCTDVDLDWMAAVLSGIASREKRALVLMGHGSEHEADTLYLRLQQKLPDGVYLACVSGGLTFETLLSTLEALPDRRVTLMPLMLTAGAHARRDLAGDDEKSWKSMLIHCGFDVHVIMQGLGSIPAVQRRFAEKAVTVFR